MTICPAYDGSVITSRYPSSEVLKQISPNTSPSAAHAVPRNAVPSSSTSSAGRVGGFEVPAKSLSLILLKPPSFPDRSRHANAPRFRCEARETPKGAPHAFSAFPQAKKSGVVYDFSEF